MFQHTNMPKGVCMHVCGYINIYRLFAFLVLIKIWICVLSKSFFVMFFYAKEFEFFFVP